MTKAKVISEPLPLTFLCGILPLLALLPGWKSQCLSKPCLFYLSLSTERKTTPANVKPEAAWADRHVQFAENFQVIWIFFHTTQGRITAPDCRWMWHSSRNIYILKSHRMGTLLGGILGTEFGMKVEESPVPFQWWQRYEYGLTSGVGENCYNPLFAALMYKYHKINFYSV